MLEPSTTSGAGAHRGPRALVYVRDQDSEGVFRQALSDLGASDVVFKIGDAAAALAELSTHASPQLVVADVSGESDPVDRARELVGACEPSTRVVIVGDANDIRLYRDFRNAGAAEYFFKPLVTAVVVRTCRALLSDTPIEERSRTGRLIFVAGVRGGVGGTTVAVKTALKLSQSPPRPVLLLDLDIQSGDAALQLDAVPNHALREALERSDRVDDLFLERGLIHVTPRLDLLASLEPIEELVVFRDEALMALLDNLAHRYRYLVVDVPVFRAFSLWRALHLPSVLLLVSDASLVSARDVARWRSALGPNSSERTTLHVMNMAGAPGSLPVDEFIRGAGGPPDVVIPFSREVAATSNLGARTSRGGAALDHALGPLLRRITGQPEPSSKLSFFARLVGAS